MSEMNSMITVTLVDDQDVTTRTQKCNDDTQYFEAFTDAFADAIVAGVKYRSWVNRLVAGIVVEIADHIETEGSSIDAELVAAALRIIEAKEKSTDNKIFNPTERPLP